MKRYWLSYERAVRAGTDHVGYNTPAIDVLQALAGKPVARLRKLVGEAAELAGEDGTPAHRQAVRDQQDLAVRIEVMATDPAEIPYVGPNLLFNPGLEKDPVNAVGWFSNVQRGTYETALDAQTAHSGAHALRITGEEKGWARWMQRIPTEPGKTYLFSVWIKASEEAGGLIWAHQGKHPTQGALLKYGSTGGEWRRLAIPSLEALSDGITLFLEHRGEGTVHFDDAYAGRIDLPTPADK